MGRVYAPTDVETDVCGLLEKRFGEKGSPVLPINPIEVIVVLRQIVFADLVEPIEGYDALRHEIDALDGARRGDVLIEVGKRKP
jgi:hypothetical protein